jgi:hypothetical protein
MDPVDRDLALGAVATQMTKPCRPPCHCSGMVDMASLRFMVAAGVAAVFLALGATAHADLATRPIASRDTTPTVFHAIRHDVSAPMRDIVRNMPPQQAQGTEQEPYAIPNILLKLTGQQTRVPGGRVRSIQTAPTGVPAPAIDLSFEAVSAVTSGCGCLPPDTNGDVSDQHFVQWVNSSWAVYDKTDGSVVQAPTPGNSFFVGFGGECENTDSGDPIALWDPRAQRWVMTQFVTNAPYGQCIAVSTSSDPLGTYNRYEFQWPNFGDYPKLSIWTDDSQSQDAYLLTTHEFDAGGSFLGASFIAMQRDKMLVGDASAAVIRFPGFDAYGVEPVNLVGTLNAPGNACPSYVHFDGNTSDYLFWDMCLDWTTPANTTVSANPTRVAGAPFIPYGGEVPQQGTANGLDSFGTHIMYRANARQFPDGAPTHMSLVVNHAVLGADQQSGINWVHFDLDDQGTVPPVPTALAKRIVDQGTYAPDDNNRWMGGIAIDGSANIGVGFSKSSSTMHPQILISGRSLGDDAGTLRDETSCTATIANGSQTSSSDRWGDYSAMSVDPVDQCTFYFTNEYYPTTASSSWHTRVCSFKFDGCGEPDYAIVADTPTRLEVCGATTSTDPAYDLRIGVLNGFTGPVSLTASGVPAGATAMFSSNPVDAPGSSTLTLVDGATLPSGEYTLNVTATSGTDSHSLPLQLGVSAESATAVQLVTPTNMATDVKVYPVLNWASAVADRIFGDGFDGTTLPGGGPIDALSYTVDVATDSAFTNIVASSTVATTTWTVDVPLAASTQYYWRVTPHNYCGDGAVSITFTFTTGVPGVCPTGTTASTLYEDTFESGVNGWTTSGSGGTAWAQGAAPSGTGMSTTVWQVPDNTVSSDRSLTSPSIVIPAGVAGVILSFDDYHNSEQNGPDACWDTSSMEASTDGTTFNYLDTTHLLTDPYNGLASNDTPVGSRNAWCYVGPGGSSSPTHAVVDLDSFAGQSLNVRFRMVSDSNTAANAPNGLVLDNFKVEVCQ